MLPIPVEIKRSALSPELVQSVHQLNGSCPGYFTMTLLLVWLSIFAAIAVAQYVDTWWIKLLAIAFIATRINLLALLIHDQSHLLGYRHRFGDLLVNLFCAYPMLVLTVQGYARIHLAHHRHYFTRNDPDHLRKSGPEWQFPKTRLEWLKLLAKDVLGLNLPVLIRGKDRSDVGLENYTRRGFNPAWLRPLFWLVVLAVLVATGTWQLFLLYWLIPILTVVQVIVRWGAVCEHQYNQDESVSIMESTPLIELCWWDRLLLPNLNFSLHIYHHYFPGVAFSRLSQVHRLFKQAGLVNDQAVFHGYADYLRYLTRH